MVGMSKKIRPSSTGFSRGLGVKQDFRNKKTGKERLARPSMDILTITI